MEHRLALALVLAACHGAPAAAPEPAPAEPVTVHGMLLFGERATYLSHLPMFHPPHDYQILLVARLAGGAGADDPAAARVADQAATGERLYTFVPEPFALSRSRQPGFHMQGEIVRGHFERGGQSLRSGVDATVERVIRFRRLDPAAARGGPLTYLLFGGASEAFLAHDLTAPPDFDQVLAVELPPAAVAPDALAAGVLARFPDLDRDRPLAPGQTAEAEIEGVTGRRTIRIREQLYLERDELAE